MRNLTISKQIKCEFTPEDWALLTFTFDDAELRPIAQDLNESLEVLFNGGSDKNFVREMMHKELHRYVKYGAFDTEPRMFLEYVLNHLYGGNNA